MSLLSRLAVQAAKAWGFLSAQQNQVSAEYLVVAGGGGGQQGGGGAGGLLTSTFTLSTLNTYSITVGAGGPNTGATNVRAGSNSVVSGTGLSTVTAIGGGYGGGGNYQAGSGGSGGGGSNDAPSTGGTGTSGQGNNGGNGASTYGGGGGGAGAAGSNQNGGNGSSSSISGSSVTYAGGGGGGSSATSGTGGTGGGGAGSNASPATAGTVNTGGGGGGSWASTAGAGGSGIVIISYTSAAPKFVGGTITTSGGKQIHTFTSTGNLTPIGDPISASYLVVAGGGGGGAFNAGVRWGIGGNGGSATANSTTLYTNGTYIVTVGAGGAGGTGSSGAAGSTGSNSVVSGTGITTITANGGAGNTFGVPGSAGYGNGTTNASGTEGYGGIGLSSSISGSSVKYAGGGSYGNATGSFPADYGTLYGAGLTQVTGPVSAPIPNRGGGGGGGQNQADGGNRTYTGQTAGSGVVIISYSGTQKFNGGVITSSGGNTIHTFNATGALTPISTTLTNSLRFQSASSQSANRTFITPTNNKIWTWSAWVKRGSNIGSANQQHMFDSWVSGSSQTGFIFSASTDTIELYDYTGTYGFQLVTTQVFRDPSAWYHITVACDTTQATAANRLKLYINGSQVTAFGTSTYPSLNYNTLINAARAHYLGQRGDSNGFFDGYMTDIYFIDGQALEPYYFGNNNDNGVWAPIKYYGTYGTNGFYLQFANGTSTTTLGTDSSGNGNNWTLTNFTRSAGVSDCWMYDVPAPASGASATQPSSNYCVLNPIYANTQGIGTVSNSNLRFTFGNATTQALVGTFGASTGKWYWEFIASANPVLVGIRQVNTTDRFSNSILWGGSSISATGDKWVNGTSSAYAGASWTTGDVIGVAVDMDGGTITFYKNNTSQGSINLSLATITDFVPAFNNGASTAFAGDVNFGNRSFAYTPPSGFVALCTANLPVATIKRGNQYMDATLWSGDSTTTRAITNSAGFSPDLVWIKNRTVGPTFHELADSVRGTLNYLSTNNTNAETTTNLYGALSAFNSNGFSITAGTDPTYPYDWTNKTGYSYVAWQWDAGSSTVTNTSGSISSQVRASTTAGFSIVTFTGNATAGATVGHGLGVAPKMVIYKARNNGNDWWTYHAGLTSAAYAIALNTTGAQNNTVNFFNSTAPNSTVLTLGYWNNATGFNLSTQNYVAYCFAEIAGFSRFGSYTGNGSTDGTFVYTGFRPKFLMIKEASGTNAASASWQILDTSRNPSNVSNTMLYPNLSGAEGTGDNVDILSNGFKLRASGYFVNESGGTYIYMAFAENPFANANAR